jgi:hypothetical protein
MVAHLTLLTHTERLSESCKGERENRAQQKSKILTLVHGILQLIWPVEDTTFGPPVYYLRPNQQDQCLFPK